MVVTAARARYPDLEIIVLTGSDPEEVGPRCRSAGASRVLHKAARFATILAPDAAATPPVSPPPLVLPMRVVVERHIVRAVELCGGNLTQAANALQIALNTLKSHLARIRGD